MIENDMLRETQSMKHTKMRRQNTIKRLVEVIDITDLNVDVSYIL